MKRLLLAGFLGAVGAAVAAPIHDAVALGPLPKVAFGPDANGRHQNGLVRALPKSVTLGAWEPVAGGYQARARASSEGAQGIRVRLDLGTLPGAVEVRAQGEGPVETMPVDPLSGPFAWTPWTDGPAQVIEVFSRVQPSDAALRIGAVVHMTEKAFAKAAAACTVSTSCSTGDAALDAAIAERKKSLLKLSFIDAGGAFICSATLVDTPLRPAPYVLTANHCIGNDAAAASITSRWFFEQAPCGASTLDPANIQVAGGMQVVFPNYNVDMTLLLMNVSPPAGVTFAPMNTTRLATNAAVVNLSHPRGDASRLATGTIVGETRNFDLPYDMYRARMTRGMIEPGSSGSGLFTLANGTLQLRGVTSAADDELSCTNTSAAVIFGRIDVLYPQMAQFIGAGAQGADDAPNRVKEWANVIAGSSESDMALNARATPELNLGTRQINYPGDVDVYRFFVSAPTVVSAFTTGSTDTVGTILDSRGEALIANDDAQNGNLNMGMSTVLFAGTYYLHVAHWDPAATGSYSVTLRADNVGTENFTALWWNASESGWGLNVNHQGNTLFATLFTYDSDGAPMWLVMSNGVRQGDGSFRGDLARTTGPVFNAQPWGAVGVQNVGTMSISFSSASSMQLSYSVNGVQVQKSLTRQEFSTRPTCTWSHFDRSRAFNFQDLWWNPAENGWGINIAHQGDILFTTLFTYGADGRGRWYVMSSGNRTSPGVYTGILYETRGPAFNAVPWGATTSTPVGNMTLTFNGGNQATLLYDVGGVRVTKQIQRQVFSTPKVECES